MAKPSANSADDPYVPSALFLCPPPPLLSQSSKTNSTLPTPQDWIDPTSPPSYAPFQCRTCTSPLVLLLQVHADLATRFPGHERRLYVFACRKKACRRTDGSVRAIRATRVSVDALAKAKERAERAEEDRKEKERRDAERKEREKGLGEALFGVAKGAFGAAQPPAGANPFATGGGGGAAAPNPFAKPAAAASANPFSAPSTSSAPAPQQQKPESTPSPTITTSESDLPKTFAAALSLNNPQQPSGPPPPPVPWPAESDLPPPYPVSYLSEADYETLDPLPPAVPQATSMEIDEDFGGGGGSSSKSKSKTTKEDKDVFESEIDGTFQKFADRLAQNPDQCIRYEFGGAPLLYSKTDAVGRLLHDAPPDAGNENSIGRVLPRCGHCGRARVFEVQLTPRAIVELEEGDDAAGGGGGALDGMDWGTVVVAVCEGDCVPRGTADGEVGYSEEWVGVQWEELTSRR